MKDTRNSNDRDRGPSAAEQAGEAIGGIGGTAAGAALGALAGPVGAIVGGIAGAIGGWWAGEEAGEAVSDTDRHDPEYRRDYESLHARDDVGYDRARIAYGVGFVASRNPGYAGHAFDRVEDDVRRGWREDDFGRLRPYVQRGYEHGLDKRTRRD